MLGMLDDGFHAAGIVYADHLRRADGTLLIGDAVFWFDRRA